ncbi:MAG: DDE-type integrase/transposase/recombinase [Spirochaetales bacterium]|nr:DDE-type integrase/transposase/recombinase [Spirochaetales bacterium]
MNQSEDELRRQKICDFRYSVVAELGNPYLARGELSRLIRAKAEREYEIPYSKRTSLTEGCIRRWLNQYRKFGKSGLMPHPREDRGQSRVLTGEQQTALIAMLESNPRLTATAAAKLLMERGIITKTISSSSLSRFIRSYGLTTQERVNAEAAEKNLKFEFFSPLECVQSDVMYGPAIPDADGKLRKALLMAFIDDATRRIVYARFSFSEKSILFEDGIKHILQAQGMVGKLYTDNGSSFVSGQTRRILDILGITLSHSKPGRPQGRGKVERFFRTVRDQFARPLDDRAIESLDELNTRFRTWLECEYHRSPHRGLKDRLTPLEAWMAKAEHIRPVNPAIDLERTFLHLDRRRVYKDSSFTLKGTLFEAPPILAGKRIDIYYDPHPPFTKVLITCDSKDFGEARPVNSYANSKVKRCHYKQQTTVLDGKVEELPVNIRTNLMGGRA